MKILLVDDEVALTHSLSQILRQEGYEVDVATDGQTGAELATSGRYDLLILDWMLPDKSGLEICQMMRARDSTTPVLFLTAKDTLDDRVMGLDSGADDYAIKPFELREFLARVRALLRRFSAFNRSALQVEDLSLDLENQSCDRNGRFIALSEKECELLAYFMHHRGQLLTHEQLHHALWPERKPPNSNVLAAQIRLLRRKIEAPGEPSLIHTVYGKGYRFN
ncbi:two-component system response regulator RppA [Roseofilum casamattae]|uniref:Response regulator transcription factor n=1 Tax=Roseofilum casamattae BLCC-M143 TaxID=3022442 RepID=A0ABT7BSL5_9CYAN|nr:two-component system response regulator RppA [Roseofilum casamattae]MDJ1182170.1 response regulator transcription factor [Roseofilum casamattae BLCC-M143]